MLRIDLKTLYAIYDSNIPIDLRLGEIWGFIMLKNPLFQEILIDITNDEESSFSIIECILNGKTSDEEISKETEIKLTVVRRVLYKLYDASIASYKRTKDPITKWESYNWRFEQDKASEIINKKYESLTEEIERCIKYEEENIFFACKTNNHRYKFEKPLKLILYVINVANHWNIKTTHL
jgi:transcription initiation factor TFIIE subunit alpha